MLVQLVVCILKLSGLLCASTTVANESLASNLSSIASNLSSLDYPATETVLLRIYTASSGDAFRTIDVKAHNDSLNSTCSPLTRNLYKLVVHGFAESWNMTYRWNWVNELRVHMLASSQRERLCFVVVDWEELARGGKYVANYWTAIDNMQYAGELMSQYFRANGVNESNVHCIGFSLGAHMCSIFYKIYFKKYESKLGRITGLDPAGPFFKNKPTSEKLHYTDADLVDIIHTSQKFGLPEKNGHMDFYPDIGPSNINACSDVKLRFENEENVVLYEEKFENKSKTKSSVVEYENVVLGDKELNKTQGGLADVTVSSITSFFGGLFAKLKNLISGKPKRIFVKMHQFVGCSHLMSVRFFIYSISQCDYKATYCQSADEFKKNKCAPRQSLDAYPRMGYHADLSDDLYKKSMGNFFLYTYEKPPYCIKTNSEAPRHNVSEFFRYFLDNLKPPSKLKHDVDE